MARDAVYRGSVSSASEKDFTTWMIWAREGTQNLGGSLRLSPASASQARRRLVLRHLPADRTPEETRSPAAGMGRLQPLGSEYTLTRPTVHLFGHIAAACRKTLGRLPEAFHFAFPKKETRRPQGRFAITTSGKTSPVRWGDRGTKRPRPQKAGNGGRWGTPRSLAPATSGGRPTGGRCQVPFVEFPHRPPPSPPPARGRWRGRATPLTPPTPPDAPQHPQRAGGRVMYPAMQT